MTTLAIGCAPLPSARWTSPIRRSRRNSPGVTTEVGRRRSSSTPHLSIRRQARVAARLMTGLRFCWTNRSGEGHVLLFTSGLENLTNNLPLHPVFVAFVDKAARYLSGHERLERIAARRFIRAASLCCRSSRRGRECRSHRSGRAQAALAQRGANGANFSACNAQASIIFDLQMDSDAVIGVNPDRRESDLQPIPQDVQQLWSGNTLRGMPTATTVASMTSNIAA